MSESGMHWLMFCTVGSRLNPGCKVYVVFWHLLCHGRQTESLVFQRQNVCVSGTASHNHGSQNLHVCSTC